MKEGRWISDDALMTAAREHYLMKIGRERALECAPYQSIEDFDARNPACCRLRRPGDKVETWEPGVLPNDRPADIVAVIGFRCLGPEAPSEFYVAEVALRRCGTETATIEAPIAAPGWEQKK